MDHSRSTSEPVRTTPLPRSPNSSHRPWVTPAPPNGTRASPTAPLANSSTSVRCAALVGRRRSRWPTASNRPSHGFARTSRRYALRAAADGRLDDVPLPADFSPTLTDYAHPERLVTADWLASNLGRPGLVIVESDEDVLLYDTGHIPGAVKIDWHTDLNDPHVRDYINGAQFAELMDRKGVSRDDTVVIYGDKSNWWAAYAMWVFTLFGHPDVRLMNGGRAKWIEEGRELSIDVPATASTEYPVVERADSAIRAFRDDVLGHLSHLGGPLVDVRSVPEYT